MSKINKLIKKYESNDPKIDWNINKISKSELKDNLDMDQELHSELFNIVDNNLSGNTIYELYSEDLTDEYDKMDEALESFNKFMKEVKAYTKEVHKVKSGLSGYVRLGKLNGTNIVVLSTDDTEFNLFSDKKFNI